MHILHSGGWPHNYFPTNIVYQGPKRAEITLEFEDIARIQMPMTLQELQFSTAWWCTFFSTLAPRRSYPQGILSLKVLPDASDFLIQSQN